MLTIEILAVGKLKEQFLRDAVLEYSKRLSRFCKLIVTEVPEAGDDAQSVCREGAFLLPKCRGMCIPLCVEGEQMTSEQLAQFVQRAGVEGQSHITFIIGGSRGLDDSVKQLGKKKLSLSKMTFPHQLTRVMLLEQLYRSFKIINKEQYHK